jgi:hypothetical protein
MVVVVVQGIMSFKANTSLPQQQALKEVVIHNHDATSRADLLSSSLTEVLKQSGSDKYSRHHYEHYYQKWLEPYRHQVNLSFLEIGADRGASMAFWSGYFTNPFQIVGLAYGPDSAGVETKANNYSHVRIVRGDQSTVSAMHDLKQLGPYDIIVDDGSHVPTHVVFSLFHLWSSSINPGGMYIIEDLETSYWPDGDKIYGYLLRGTGIGQSPNASVVEKVKQLIDVMDRNLIGAQASQLTVLPGDDQLCSVEFGRNLVALRKCDVLEMELQPFFASKKKHDPGMLQQWIKMARSSNPEGF